MYRIPRLLAHSAESKSRSGRRPVSDVSKRLPGIMPYRMMRKLSAILMNMSLELHVSIDELDDKVKSLLNTEKDLRKEISTLKNELVNSSLADIQPKPLSDIVYAAAQRR